jgi:hypothetical protein
MSELPTTDRQSIMGRLAKRPYAEGDDLPEVGGVCLVSGANQDAESDQHRSFNWCRVVGYTVDNKFVCLQVPGCWPTVERLTNCWFADEESLLRAAAPALLGALRGIVSAVDHVEWDCTASAAHGRLDDARSVARAAIAKATGEPS